MTMSTGFPAIILAMLLFRGEKKTAEINRIQNTAMTLASSTFCERRNCVNFCRFHTAGKHAGHEFSVPVEMLRELLVVSGWEMIQIFQIGSNEFQYCF